MRFGLTLGVLILWQCTAWSNDCPTVDLTSKPPLSARKHVWQGDMGWCCSFAVVDALSLKHGKNFSPVDIAISHQAAQKDKEDCTELDEIPKAINQSGGLCREDHYKMMKSFSEEYPEARPGTSKEDLKKYLAFEKIESHRLALADLDMLQHEMRANPAVISEKCNSADAFHSPVFSNISSLREITNIAKKTIHQTHSEFLAAIAEKNCPDREKLKVSYENFKFESGNITLANESSSASKKLIELLQSGNSPVIRISTRSLFNEKMNLREKVGSFLGGSHAVNVVGVRPVNGKCYLKVRDSSFGGRSCADVHKKNILCQEKPPYNGTYEVKMNTFVNAARAGMVVY